MKEAKNRFRDVPPQLGTTRERLNQMRLPLLIEKTAARTEGYHFSTTERELFNYSSYLCDQYKSQNEEKDVMVKVVVNLINQQNE